jgi:hypothetical protein
VKVRGFFGGRGKMDTKFEVYDEKGKAKEVKFQLKEAFGNVRLRIVDITGREIKTILTIGKEGCELWPNVHEGFGFPVDEKGAIKTFKSGDK